MTDAAGAVRLLAAQAARLAPLRERMLRRVVPASRGATLDLGAGTGSLSAELAARVRGPVIALDVDPAALGQAGRIAPVLRVAGDAARLPLRDASLDLVVTQCAWLWFRDPAGAAAEVLRVLAPGGALVVAAEPDYGGAIEHPPVTALAPAWRAALERAGADPCVGRKLAGLLRRAGFADVEVEVFGRIAAPADALEWKRAECDLLHDLASPQERGRASSALEAAVRAGPDLFAFVPWLGLVAAR